MALSSLLRTTTKFDKKRFGKEIELFEKKPHNPQLTPSQASDIDFFHNIDVSLSNSAVSDEPAQKKRKKHAAHGSPLDDVNEEKAIDQDNDISIFPKSFSALSAPSNESDTDEQRRAKRIEAVNLLRNQNKIYLDGADCPAPLSAFDDLLHAPLSLPTYLVNNVAACGYSAPTPIQMQTIPILLARRDVIACAPTGSGKTAAYLIPIFAILKAPGKSGFRAVVVAPTRELAAQIHREAERLGAGRKWRLVHLTKATAQGSNLAAAGDAASAGDAPQKLDVLIASPMRLVHLIRQGAVDLSRVELLVLDEADRLLDVDAGFAEQIDEVLAACSGSPIGSGLSGERRLVRALFSATMLPAIEELARSVLIDPIRVTIGIRNSATENIRQKLLFVGKEEGKLLAVRQLVREGIKPPVLIFVQSIERARQLFHELVYDGVNVDVIHADRTQAQRDSIIKNFRIGKIWMLICTDLMARGIDFKGVNCVLNFDFPQSVVSYIHRIGRTGRAGRTGEAITLYTEEDSDYLRSIANVMRLSGCDVPDWMLKMKSISRKDKKYLAAHAPERAGVSTVAVIDKFKGTRNKRKLLATVGYREPPAAKQHALQKSEGDRTVDGAKVPVVKKSPQSRKGKGVPA